MSFLLPPASLGITTPAQAPREHRLVTQPVVQDWSVVAPHWRHFLADLNEAVSIKRGPDPSWGSSLNPAREKSSQYTFNNASIVHGLVTQGLLVPSGVRGGIHRAVVKASEATMQNHGAGIGGRRWHNMQT